jgi:opacity protein-like surface antigen
MRLTMRAAWSLIGASAFVLGAVALPRTASAFERQQHFGLSAGGAVMSTNGGGSPFGFNLGLHYTYGLTDAFSLMVEADASGFPQGAPPKNPPPQPGFVATGGIGALYIFDVLRWVPYVGGTVGAGYFGGGYLSQGLAAPDVQLAVGVDYQLTRSWTVGVAYRQHFFLTQMNTYPEFTTLGARFEYVWGW